MSTYVMVHGARHGAWCWYKVVPLLQRAGHIVVAPDVPSLGRNAPIHVTDEGFGRVPRVYVECLQDKVVPLPLQRQTVPKSHLN